MTLAGHPQILASPMQPEQVLTFYTHTHTHYASVLMKRQLIYPLIL